LNILVLGLVLVNE